MKKFLGFAVVIQIACMWFMYTGSQKSEHAAQTYKVERDSLMITNRCPQPMRVQIHAGVCLNKSERHDMDFHVSQLKTAANDTVAFAPLCQSCFEKLSSDERWPFYERLIGLYEQQNRRDIQVQIKRGL